jgi:PAS domain S-box-containing protein
LEAIFRSVKDAIITVDPELRVIEANKSTEAICGIAVKEIAGKTFSQSLNHCSKSCSEVLRLTLEKKMTIKEYRVECGHQQRHQQTVSVSSSPLLDPEGKFMGAVLAIRDITLLRDLERELRERHQFQNIIGRSKKMQDTYRLLEDLANLETTVLITGESGTGKDLVARALHYSGQRAFKPFVTVNCSALAESLLESELFGHVKGAFTGAIKDKQGRFQAANGGTILLDEIGDISPLIQLKLLRVLQEKEFERVGEFIPQKVDVRVIACTNKDLKEKVKRGEFRQDLYYRLKVVEVSLPPLRERLEDLPLLMDHFCRSFNERFKKNIEGISNEVLGRFMDYPWPGNVRELEHVMEHAFVLCHGGMITLEHLPSEIRDDGRTERIAVQEASTHGPNGAQEVLNALNKTHWNKTKAARLLGISRRTIYRKIYLHQLCSE